MIYEESNSLIYNFKGIIKLSKNEIGINNDNIILRGCCLRNTQFVIGIVIYNGHNTKIMRNSVKSKEKKSSIEKKLNKYIALIFVLLLCYCFVAAIMYMLWFEGKKE